jgi:hypothetical protein
MARVAAGITTSRHRGDENPRGLPFFIVTHPLSG